VEWIDGNVNYRSQWLSCDHIPSAQRVVVSVVRDEQELDHEEWLVFSKSDVPTKQVIEDLLADADDDNERERIQRSAQEEQSLDIAFKMIDGQISPADNSYIFAFLPTLHESHLRFVVQARYQTTPARDRVPENKWNSWLIDETASFLPEILAQIKEAGLLLPSFLEVLPLEGDGVPTILSPVSETIGRIFRDSEFIPNDEAGYSKPSQVFYPHADALRRLLSGHDLEELTEVKGAKWLHPEIGDNEKYRRRFDIIKAAGVREVGASQLVTWLAKQSAEWLKRKDDEWLIALYQYLNGIEREREKICTLPLVRLEDGTQICANDRQVFLPPSQDGGYLGLDVLGDLPFVRAALLSGEKKDVVRSFLEAIGVKPFKPEQVIRHWLLPKYRQSELPTLDENRAHILYLFTTWNQVSQSEAILLRDEIRHTALLRAYKGTRREECQFVEPQKMYLPQAYTDSPDLEVYFSRYPQVWFLVEGYMESIENPEKRREFLKEELGCADMPRQLSIPLTDDTKRQIRGTWRVRAESKAEDCTLEGLESFCQHSFTHDSSISLWHILLKLRDDQLWVRLYQWDVERSPKTKWQYKRLFATRVRSLLWTTAWLPDEKGIPRKPAELFLPTDENHALLGNIFPFLHPDLASPENADDKSVQWLGDKLDIKRNATKESVLSYLRSLSGNGEVTVETMNRIYNFLRPLALSKEHFAEKPLVFTPTPTPRWWKADEVFWEDESVVFGNSRGCLKTHYPESLKPFFIGVGVNIQAQPLDYVRAAYELAVSGDVSPETRDRIHPVYRRIWNSTQDGGDWQSNVQWQQMRDGMCWLGQKGDQFGFFNRSELVSKDNDYLAGLFNNHAPFWMFEDLQEFANQLQIEPCSRAHIRFQPSGTQGILSDWTEKLQNLVNDIESFLKSPKWSKHQIEGTSSRVFVNTRVFSTEQPEMAYTLKGITLPDRKPRDSHFDEERRILWLTSGIDEKEFPDLIGDALQEYFGVPELREFAEDLLSLDREKVLERWQRRGLHIKSVASPAGETPTQMRNVGRDTLFSPSGQEDGTGNKQSTDQADGVLTRIQEADNNQQGQGGHRDPRGYSDSTGTEGKGGHTGTGRGGETELHEKLIAMIVANPELLEPGMRNPQCTHKFSTNDKPDILLEDRFGRPVAVEVEPNIPIGVGKEVGLLQAGKYKHLAAAEKGLPCEQARGFLVAPTIPDDIKAKCHKLGIEPKEIQV
jgi:hypothetical protein